MRLRAGALARAGFALLVTALFALPLYIALAGVFRHGDTILGHPLRPPLPPTIVNVQNAVHMSLVQQGLKTSLIVTAGTLLLTIPVSAMAAYYIARWDTRPARLLLIFMLLGLLLPPQVVLYPTTVVLRKLHLMFTYWGLICAFTAYFLPFAVFVFAGFVRTIGRELDEAAKVDGASHFTTFWRIVFPLMRPATASVMIFVAVWAWNDFITPLIVLGALHGVTITTGIYLAVGQFSVDYGQEFGIMFIASLPMLALFFALQKRFVSGLTAGSTKG